MSEPKSGRHPLDPQVFGAMSRKTSDSQLELAEDGDVVFEPKESDESPTIISKNKPSSIQTAKPVPAFTGSLRGRRLAHFELIAPIGVGGMAAVIKAKDTQLDRFVALKILPPGMAQDPENIKRFHQEARAAAKLDHENIARVFYCGEDQSLQFIAFEYVEGENLRTILERRKRLPVAEAVRYILQIATGLDHASSRGVVHRDIKPSNIIVSPNGRAKLVDMGLARSMEPQTDQLTQSGVTLGTFDYISPEQALEPRDADTRSDIYSLGCTFYHMLTGQPPVPEGTAAKKLQHHQSVQPPDPRQLNPEVTDEVAHVLFKMMAKEVRNRHQRPMDLIHDLMRVAEKVGVGEGHEGVIFMEAPVATPSRPRPLLTLALGALALGILLVILSVHPGTKKSDLNPPAPGIFSGSKKGPDTPKGVVEPKNNPETKRPAGVITTAAELRQALADSQKSEIVVAGTIELPAEGLTVSKDRILEIRSNDAAPAKLVYQYHFGKEPSAGLRLEAGEITFKNIHFELESKKTPVVPVGLIAIRGSAKVEFQRCTFEQEKANFGAFFQGASSGFTPLASVLIDPQLEGRPTVLFKDCFFPRGQAAVALNGQARIAADNCAFGPHNVLFHLRGKKQGSVVGLDHCSALVVKGPVFAFEDEVGCQLQVKNSVLAQPPLDGSAGDFQRDEPQLIRQLDPETSVQFLGERNRYFDLKPLWVEGERFTGNYKEFLKQVQEGQGSDVESLELTDFPFPSNALALLEEAKPAEAFQVRNLLDLRKRGTQLALGLQKNVWGEMKRLDRLPEYKLKDKEKIIDPDGDHRPDLHIYNSLKLALLDAEPGTVFLLKHGHKTREVDVSLPLLEESRFDVTVKPLPGYHPLLVGTDETKQAMFRLGDGKIHFEQLEFELRHQPLIAFKGIGQASFKQCVVTLNPSAGRASPLSVCTVLATENENPPPSAIAIEDSFLRGEGDLAFFKHARPLKLKVKNSIVALSGSIASLLLKEPSTDPIAVSLDLQQSSFFFGEPFLLARGRKNKEMIQFRVEPCRDNLFVALGQERPLVSLENLDVEGGEEGFRKVLDWRGDHNAYMNLGHMIELRPDNLTVTEQLKTKEWQMSWERSAEFATGAKLPTMMGQRALSNLPHDQFRLKGDEAVGFGTTLDGVALPTYLLPRAVGP